MSPTVEVAPNGEAMFSLEERAGVEEAGGEDKAAASGGQGAAGAGEGFAQIGRAHV